MLQRFSVAGLNSFDTIYFNECLRLQKGFKRQFVLISRYAIGNMKRIDRR